MDETNSGTTLTSMDAWSLAALGMGIGVMVDRQINSPQVIQPSTGYGVDQFGNVYPLGQPATAQNTVSPAPASNGTGMLLLIALVLLVANHG